MAQNNTAKINFSILFGLLACSWMPHWSCHYYRLETGSSFVVHNYAFSETDSYLLMLFYTTLIAINIVAISRIKIRFSAALLSGIFHLLLGGLHLFRQFSHFGFEVLGYEWSYTASLRESLIVIPFGIFCLWVAYRSHRVQKTATY